MNKGLKRGTTHRKGQDYNISKFGIVIKSVTLFATYYTNQKLENQILSFWYWSPTELKFINIKSKIEYDFSVNEYFFRINGVKFYMPDDIDFYYVN